MTVFLNNKRAGGLVDALLPKLHELRRDIHKNPELGYRESGTTQRIQRFLDRNGVPFCNFEHMTGGYVYIDCKKERTAGFRADLDALPIEEKNEVEYKSCSPGIMHACGHDMHASIAAGLAAILFKIKEQLSVNILIVFQPAEECNPTGGAKAVLQQGIFEKYRVSEFYGLHMWPSLAVGDIAVKSGALMGSSDKMQIKVLGKNAHAAEPQKGVDAISIATELLNAVEHKIRREISPFETVLISVGSLKTTGRYNIICDEVLIEGTIRSLKPEVRTFVHQRIRELATNIASAYRGKAEVTIENGYGTVVNDKELTEKFVYGAKKMLGAEHVHTDINPSLIGEDFYAYGQAMPALYFLMGCDCERPLHNDRFLPAEETIEEALKLLTGYFLEYV